MLLIVVVAGCSRPPAPGEPVSIRTDTDFARANEEARILLEGRMPKLEQGEDAKVSPDDRKAFEQALSLYEGMIAWDPQRFAAYFGAGTVNWALGNYDRALERMQGFLLNSPSNPPEEVRVMMADAHYVMAMSYYGKQDWLAAENEITQAIEAYPEVPNYLALRASTRIQRKDVQGAREDIRAALKVDPAHPRSLQVMGLLEAAGEKP